MKSCFKVNRIIILFYHVLVIYDLAYVHLRKVREGYLTFTAGITV